LLGAAVRARPAGWTAAALLAVLTTLGAACGSGPLAHPECQRDDQCGSGEACVGATCLPRAAPPASWSVEVAPKTDSTAGFTEILGPTGPADAFDLTATWKVDVTGTLSFDNAATPLLAAHVVLSVPPLIAGRPPLQYETDLQPAMTTVPLPTFTLSVPKNVIARAGTLQLLPTAPDNATHAPSTFSVMVAPMLALPVASKSLTVSGRLLSALGDPLVGLVARAFVHGNLASNVVNTTAAGFSLIVPADPTNAPSLAVELEAATSDSPQPHFWAKPFALTANTDLGDVQLPAYGQPNTFSFAFQGSQSGDPAVVGALVRARTVLEDDMTGTTDFQRDGLTDATGQASLSLLPGSTAALRLYDIAVVPPADSVYATKCLETFGVAAGGLQPAVTLERRPTFAGSVVGADGKPVAGVVIQATRTSSGAEATPCDEYASSPQVTSKTRMDGTFSFSLDAGMYTLDFDPPTGVPYPRLTEVGVAVAAGAASHDVQLPPGAVVEGNVSDSSGQPLPQAGVRLYGPSCVAPMMCAGASTVLEAQARADASGHYRVVIPAP
jgi:hypothetical protein